MKFLLLAASLLVFLLLSGGGCQTEPRPAGSVDKVSGAWSSASVSAPATSGGRLDLGQDWAAAAPNSALAVPATPGSEGGAGSSGTVWGIVLGTCADDMHPQSAASLKRSLAQSNRDLANAWVHSTERGSMVVYGRYTGPDDPAAKRDLQWIKSLMIDSRPVFQRVMLTPVIRGGPTQSPYQLLSVRKQYPDVDPLYTLQVGVWGVFGGNLSLEQVQRRAEADVMRLRNEGLPAFVHHDPDKQMSMVTVGLFDYRALDPQSGLYSPDVEQLLRRFPAHLVNGEPIQEVLTGGGTRTQKPALVEVPRQ